MWRNDSTSCSLHDRCMIYRDEWMKCNGMSCEEKALTEDLMQLLQYELTESQYQPPEAVSHASIFFEMPLIQQSANILTLNFEKLNCR